MHAANNLSVDKEPVKVCWIKVHDGKVRTEQIGNVLSQITATPEMWLTSNYNPICNHRPAMTFTYRNMKLSRWCDS